MFGTMGISELIIILVIVLIIFGAGKLPQIGEGVGKALRGFKKEVNDIPPLDPALSESNQPAPMPMQSTAQAVPAPATTSGQTLTAPKPTAPYIPGPELTPGTTAALRYNMAAPPQQAQPLTFTAAQSVSAQPAGQQPPTMEERAAAPTPMMRAQYPPLPAGAQVKPVAKRPSAIVNKDAVARVQAQQAAMKAKATQPVVFLPGICRVWEKDLAMRCGRSSRPLPMSAIRSILRCGQSKPNWILLRRNSSNPLMRPKKCPPRTKSLRNKRELGCGLISLRDFFTLLCRISRRTIGDSVALSVFCFAGCVQDSPPSSQERTLSFLLELLCNERPEMWRMAAEFPGKIGDPRAADSIFHSCMIQQQ